MMEATATPDSEPYWVPWRVHDVFNLASLPFIIALTFAALLSTPWNYPLAIAMTSYIIADGIWIALQPGAVGSPSTLIGHHVVTVLLLACPLSYAPLLRMVSWMTVVEVNTLLLILKRWLRSSKLLDFGFNLTWLLTRVLWFPIVAVYVNCFVRDWGLGWLAVARRVVTCSCVTSLALLQLVWTRNALLPKQDRAGAGEDAVGEADGKEGFL